MSNTHQHFVRRNMHDWTEVCCGACYLDSIAKWKDDCTTLSHSEAEQVFWDLAGEGYFNTKYGSRRTVCIGKDGAVAETQRRLRAIDAAKRLVA